MFLDNKYTTVYWKIVKRAQARFIVGYTEKHHIIPVSLGGLNGTNNIVALTAREHYLVHLLLTKMTVGTHRRSMAFALSMFNTNCKNMSRTVPSSRWYEYSRTLLSEVRQGVPASAQCLAAVSLAKRGVPISAEHSRKLSVALTKKKSFWAYSPQHQVYTGCDLRAFCAEHGISYNTVRKHLHHPYVITAGNNRGWLFNTVPMQQPIKLQERALAQAHLNRKTAVSQQWQLR